MATVTASLNYTNPLDLYKVEKPFFSNIPAPDGRQSNQVVRRYDGIDFRNIRDDPSRFTIDEHGFELFQFGQEDQPGNFESDAWIQESYYPVVESLLQCRFRDVGVKIFDHTVQCSFTRNEGADNS